MTFKKEIIFKQNHTEEKCQNPSDKLLLDSGNFDKEPEVINYEEDSS